MPKTQEEINKRRAPRMSELRISETQTLPIDTATWVLAYLAKRGAGKTYCAAVQAEEMLKVGIPIGVIDGMGIWWGLRVSADGKGAGLPIVVFGGEHADLPLVPERAAEMAKAIVESNISFVLDLSGFSKTQMRKFVQNFLDELYRINRVKRHVFIEEADMFAPQKPFGPEAIMCFSAVDNFVRRGGNHNLGCTLITQRTAVLNKDVLTQADCLVILRTLAPQDKEAIQSWVKEQTEEDKEKLKAFYDSLNDLENGEAWVWHPEKPAIYCRVKFRLRETFHATREFILNPHAGEIKLMDIGDFINKFKTVFKDVKPIEPKGTVNTQELISMRQTNEQITQELKEAKTENEKLAVTMISAIEEAYTKGNTEASQSIETLRSAFTSFLFPNGLPPATIQTQTTNRNSEIKTSMTLNHTALQVAIQDVGVETINFSTKTQKGQMMYCIVNELSNTEEGWTNGELIDKCLEHGWSIGKSTVSVELSKWVGSGLLIRTVKGYRLPKFVKFEVKKD